MAFSSMLRGQHFAGVIQAVPRAPAAAQRMMMPWQPPSLRHISALPLASQDGGGMGPGSRMGGHGGNGKGGHGGSSGSGGSDGSGSSRNRWGWARAAAMALGSGVLLGGEGAAWAGKPQPAKPPPKEELTIDKATDMLWSLVGPVLTNLGFSGCCGAATGYALKKIGQVMAFAVGMLFLLVQGLAYTGFITVNWSHVHGTVTQALDFNKDGKLDADDFKPMVRQGLAALSQGVPSVGGFLAGFIGALRYM